MGRTRRPDRWLTSGLVLGTVALALRLNNALRLPLDLGFDAPGNWRYIRMLLQSWQLPEPGADWATSHPPFFYYAAAALGRLLDRADRTSVVAINLASTLLGIGIVALAVWLVHRSAPGNPRRPLIAGGLLLFLPVHISLSAMLSEEITAAFLTSLAICGVCAAALAPRVRRHELGRSMGVGLVAGLALLTKLSGLLVIAAAGMATLARGWRRGEARNGLEQALVLGLVAAIAGGWYYGRNQLVHGYVYPQDLAVHEVMFDMPPGERGVLDYVRVPLATWTDPQLLDPGLLRSVWGSTYATVWFDGHRHFLPVASRPVRRMGTAILLLALLPTAAFLIGLVRGASRIAHGEPGCDVDLPLLLLTGLTLVGYVAFTWGNPWFAAVKGSYLLGLSVPFAYYASEVLADLTRAPAPLPFAVWTVLLLLVALVAITFSFGLVFEKLEAPGLPWRAGLAPMSR